MGTTPGGGERFPGYDVVAQARAWDPVTAGVVLARLAPRAPLRFFDVAEEAVCRPLLDRLLAQDGEPRVPVFEAIDARLAEDETDGWRYDDMPPDGDAWRASLAALGDEARERFATAFPPRGYENLGLDRREHWEAPEADARDPEPWSHRVEAARRRHGPSGRQSGDPGPSGRQSGDPGPSGRRSGDPGPSGREG
ncbi:MAG: gluconate 2-dehydrogenase subunit 3 family protein [Actinobacteria bacterium]|nr:gluconate 2-dehydrogenase subunit 3 family protein [Actinomycetota bacterium]